MFHIAAINEEELFPECSPCILRLADKPRYIDQACFGIEANQILVDLFPEYAYNSLSCVAFGKIVDLGVVVVE